MTVLKLSVVHTIGGCALSASGSTVTALTSSTASSSLHHDTAEVLARGLRILSQLGPIILRFRRKLSSGEALYPKIFSYAFPPPLQYSLCGAGYCAL